MLRVRKLQGSSSWHVHNTRGRICFWRPDQDCKCGTHIIAVVHSGSSRSSSRETSGDVICVEFPASAWGASEEGKELGTTGVGRVRFGTVGLVLIQEVKEAEAALSCWVIVAEAEWTCVMAASHLWLSECMHSLMDQWKASLWQAGEMRKTQRSVLKTPQPLSATSQQQVLGVMGWTTYFVSRMARMPWSNPIKYINELGMIFKVHWVPLRYCHWEGSLRALSNE